MIQHITKLQHYNVHAQNDGVLGYFPGLLPGFFPALSSMEGRTPQNSADGSENSFGSIGQSSFFPTLMAIRRINDPFFGPRMIHDSQATTMRICKGGKTHDLRKKCEVQ